MGLSLSRFFGEEQVCLFIFCNESGLIELGLLAEESLTAVEFGLLRCKVSQPAVQSLNNKS